MRKGIQAAIVACAITAGAAVGNAAEHVTLSNGFAMDCNHHALVEGQMRLYLSSGESSYIALKPEEVTEVEIVADPPATPAAQAALPPPIGVVTLTQADLREMLATAGQAHNIDADLLASVVKAESASNPHAVSKAGAHGLMQLMPSTATDLGVEDSFEPGQSVRGGSAYLDTLLTKYHENLALALAAYNAGPAAVDKYHGIPPYRETRTYVARVIHEFNRRVQAREAAAMPVTERAPAHE